MTARRQQPDVQRAAAQLTKEVPYEIACELFAELTGLPLSAHTADEVTQAVAEGLTVLDVAPSREAILDYYHCSERLHKVAVLHYGAHPERQREWCEAALAQLFYGEVHGVLWGLQCMKPTNAQAAQEIAKLITYLQRHQERVDYRFAR